MMKKDSLIKATVILGLGVLFAFLGAYLRIFTLGIESVVSKNSVIIIVIAIIIIGMFLSLILTYNLFTFEKQQRTLEKQQLYITHLQEMMQVIKAQRHDFINHLQVVYGLLQIGENNQALEYITDLYQDIQVSGEILRLAIPELIALLMVKMGVATARGISLSIAVESDLAELEVKPLDMAAIVGNLINNALEAVEDFPALQRKVDIKVSENTRYFVIQTLNPGYISPEIRRLIFTSGFSTKQGTSERGLGLSSVEHLVKKYRGKIVLSSHQEKGTRFTVCFPKTG